MFKLHVWNLKHSECHASTQDGQFSHCFRFWMFNLSYYPWLPIRPLSWESWRRVAKTKAWLEGWTLIQELSPATPSEGGERPRLGDKLITSHQWLKQSCLWNSGGLESFPDGESFHGSRRSQHFPLIGVARPLTFNMMVSKVRFKFITFQFTYLFYLFFVPCHTFLNLYSLSFFFFLDKFWRMKFRPLPC